jgi:hypothetical protein
VGRGKGWWLALNESVQILVINCACVRILSHTIKRSACGFEWTGRSACPRKTAMIDVYATPKAQNMAAEGTSNSAAARTLVQDGEMLAGLQAIPA